MNAINHLFALGLPIMISPEYFNKMRIPVTISDIYGEPLVNISRSSMSDSGKNIKRALDVLVSGSYVFKSPHPEQAIRELRALSV
jgi:pentose-5-phosphate-3-epimerase